MVVAEVVFVEILLDFVIAERFSWMMKTIAFLVFTSIFSVREERLISSRYFGKKRFNWFSLVTLINRC